MTICNPWRVGNALNRLNDQVNQAAPNRSKVSDGSIGDPAHQTELCASQHNSCCVRYQGIWIIRARDWTHDPAGGFDSYAFAEQLRLGRDPRVRYIISNRRITGPNYGWVWHPYSGTADPHINHAHVSVWDDQARFDNTAPWRIAPPAAAAPSSPVLEVDVIYQALSVPAGAKDVVGQLVPENGQCLATASGPFSLTGSEFFSLPASAQPVRIKMTWARLLTLCQSMAGPEQRLAITLTDGDVQSIAQEVAAQVVADDQNDLTKADVPAIAEAVADRFGVKLGGAA